MKKVGENLEINQGKKTIAGNLNSNPADDKKQQPISIHIDPKVAEEVEQLKKRIGNDDFLPFLAGLDSKPDNISKEDLELLKSLDGKDKKLSDDDFNIFQNAITMKQANKESNVDFNGLLGFTAEYSDIQNGDLDDGKFIKQSPETENMFKKSKISQNGDKIEIKLNDFNKDNDKNYSTYEFSTEHKVILSKIKNYANGNKFVIMDTGKLQTTKLKENGINPIDNDSTYMIEGVKYKYDKEKDLFTDEKSDKNFFIYSQKEGKMVSGDDAFKSVYKQVYGEKFFNKYADEIVKTPIKDKMQFNHKLTDEDIELIKNDKTSTIGQIIKFNNENADRPELKELYDINSINSVLEKLIKKQNLFFTYKDGAYGSSKDASSINLNFKNLYSDNQNMFETMYHELIHNTQNLGTSDYDAEKKAYLGSMLASQMKDGELNEQKKEDIKESVKYTLNFLAVE